MFDPIVPPNPPLDLLGTLAMMRFSATLFPLLVLSTASAGADLSALPANTWVALKPQIEQPADAREKGTWVNAGWNKLVWDPDGKRVLFYDRWSDKRHGGTSIYGNCLFSFDPESTRLRPLQIDSWFRRSTPNGGYRTVPLEDDTKPTPCSRHVYHGFDYVPDLKSVFLCNGANQTAMIEDQLRGHDLCADTWRFDLAKSTWTRLPSKEHPRNSLEDGMAYCPVTRTIVYAGHGKVWVLDLARGQWRKAREELPRSHMGMTVWYDPPRQRILLAGGGTYDRWQTRAGGFNCLYALDPKTEKITRLADCPTALCRGALAYDSQHDLFLTAMLLKGPDIEQPSGVFAYDPKRDAWHEIRSANAVPLQRNGWMPLCYDEAHNCLIGVSGTTFHAFRHVPANSR
jgi:hypothetical protein